MTTNGTQKLEQIEAEIQQTRSRVDDTIEAIREKLSPGHLRQQVLDYFRHGRAAHVAIGLGTVIKRNPLPVTILGIGLAWFVASRSRRGYGRFGDDGSDYGYDLDPEVYRYNPGLHGRPPTRSRLRHKMGSLKDQVLNKLNARASGAQDSLSHASLRIDQTGQRILRATQEQPWLAAALGFTAGAILGAGLPVTRKENEWMGKARDEIVNKVSTLGHGQFEKLKAGLDVANDSTVPEADRLGLITDEAGYGLHETISNAQQIIETSGMPKQESNRQSLAEKMQ